MTGTEEGFRDVMAERFDRMTGLLRGYDVADALITALDAEGYVIVSPGRTEVDRMTGTEEGFRSLVAVAECAEWVRRIIDANDDHPPRASIDQWQSFKSLAAALDALPDDIKADWLPEGEASRQALSDWLAP